MCELGLLGGVCGRAPGAGCCDGSAVNLAVPSSSTLTFRQTRMLSVLRGLSLPLLRFQERSLELVPTRP